MKILFVHQNFPGQYRHVAAALAQTPGWEVAALGDVKNVKQRPAIPGVKLAGYPTPQPATKSTHHYVTPLEGAVRRGQAVAKACLELKKRGFTPDLIHAHPGWGEALFLKDVFPDARLTLYCEFFYRARGSDVGFDPEYPSNFDDTFRVRVKNAASLLSLEASEAGLSPTKWQKQQFPPEYQERITVIHEGVDTDLVKPDPKAEVALSRGNLKLTPNDEVVTYVARNLEPYRGFHIFMRALPEILRRRSRAHVIVVGADGVSYGQALPDKQTYRKKLLDELSGKLDAERVHFLGQVPYAGLVGATAGVFNLVPYLGLVVSIIPVFIIALLSGDFVSVIVRAAIVFGVVQLIDGTITGPRIVGSSVGLHPVWVILALAVGGAFFGFVGLLIAMPAAVLIKLLLREGLERYKRSATFLGTATQ